MNPRPHWLSNVLCLAIVATLIWLNTGGGSHYFAHASGLTKSHIGHGWPFGFYFTLPGGVDPILITTPFAINVSIWLVLIVLPPWTLNGLLHRTLHIRLATAVALMLTASVLVGWCVPVLIRQDGSLLWNIRIVAGRLLIGLAVLSAVTWVSEKVLRSEPEEEE